MENFPNLVWFILVFLVVPPAKGAPYQRECRVSTQNAYEEQMKACCESTNRLFRCSDREVVAHAKQIQQEYAQVRPFTTGKGGAAVYHVITQSPPHTPYILKVFPEADESAWREIFHTCLVQVFRDKAPQFMHHHASGMVVNTDPWRDISPVLRPPKTQGLPIMVAEYIEGTPLLNVGSSPGEEMFAISKAMELRPRDIKSIFFQLLHAMSLAHAKVGLKHYDLHPGNVLITDQNIEMDSFPVFALETQEGRREKFTGRLLGTPLVKIIDFGLAESAEMEQSRVDLSLRWTTGVLRSFRQKERSTGEKIKGFFRPPVALSIENKDLAFILTMQNALAEMAKDPVQMPLLQCQTFAACLENPWFSEVRTLEIVPRDFNVPLPE